MAENWWEEAPVAGSPAAASPAEAGGNWWEEAPIAGGSLSSAMASVGLDAPAPAARIAGLSLDPQQVARDAMGVDIQYRDRADGSIELFPDSRDEYIALSERAAREKSYKDGQDARRRADEALSPPTIADYGRGYAATFAESMGDAGNFVHRVGMQGGDALFGNLIEQAGGPEQQVYEAPGDNFLHRIGGGIRGQQSAGFQRMMEDNQWGIERDAQGVPVGSGLNPANWSLGEDPSLAGFLGASTNVLGSLAPTVIASILSGGVTAPAAVGGAIAGGGGASDAEATIDRMWQDGTLYEASGKFRELIDSDVPVDDALAILKRDVGNASGTAQGVVGGLGGAATGWLLSPGQRLLQGLSTPGRAAGMMGIAQGEEVLQEVLEGVSGAAATNLAAGTDLSLTEGIPANAIGGLVGGTTSGGMAAANTLTPSQRAASARVRARNTVLDDTAPLDARLAAAMELGIEGLSVPEEKITPADPNRDYRAELGDTESRFPPNVGAPPVVRAPSESPEDVAPGGKLSVQFNPQQSAASAMMGESDVQVEDQAEGQAGREAGARRQAEEVQEEVTPAADMADGVDLSPRVPPRATLTGGETREQILAEIARASTADERAGAAGRLAEYDARVRAASAEPVGDDGSAGAGDAQAGLQGEDRQAAAAAPEIPDFPGLSEDKRAVEGRARDQVTKDPEAALRDYAAVPGTEGGRIINTDEAREIFSDYNSGPDARSSNAAAVHEPASWVANETYRRRMAAPVAEGKSPVVFFTGGGTGAGKSTGPKRIAQIGQAYAEADTIYDGNLSSERSSVEKIERALASGRGAYILYTFRDPVQAFVHGALPRAERDDYGRTVPTGPHADTHVGAANTYFALRERYANDPRVTIEAVFNDFEPGKSSSIRAASEEEIRALAAADSGTLQAELNAALEQQREAGNVSDRVYYGTRGEAAPAAEPAAEQVGRVQEPERLGRESAEAEAEQAPRLTPPPARAAVERTLGPANAGIEYAPTPASLPADVRRRLGVTDADNDAEGLYDPDTGRVYIFEDNIRPYKSQSREDRIAWVAAHERMGHAGIRGMFRDQAGSAAESARGMATMLDRASRNETVRALVEAMQGQREERGPRAVEEALSELAAAVRTGDFTHLQERYGVTVNQEQRSNARALMDRIVAALRRALGLSERVSDAEIFQLIEDAGRYADRGVVRGTSVRADAAAAVGRPIASRIGTRNPTAVKATESGADPGTVVGYESFKADRKAFEKNVQLLSQYPGIRQVRGKATPEKVAEAFVMHAHDNLLALHDEMPADLRARAKQWYVGANKAANFLADKYGITDVQAAASIAALSPQKDWFQNLSLAERVIDAHVNQNDRAWDPAMGETLADIFGKDQYADLRAAIEGKPLSALSSPIERAAWIRTYDQTHNDKAFPITSPEGDFISTSMTGAGNPAKIQWGSLNEAAKAITALQNGDLESISGVLGKMHKIRSFYNNIIDPNSQAGDVTIDTHAVAAALIRPLSAASVEVGHNFGTGTGNSSITGNSGTYGIYAEAYRRAAAERGVLPREMQSITWEAVRTLYPSSMRRPNSRVLREVNDNWTRYEKREIDHGEAVKNAIDAGGGITAPDWAGSAARVDEGEWSGAFRPAVARAGVPGRRAGSAAAGDGDSGRARGIHPDAAVTLNIGLSTAEERGGGELSRAEVMRAVRATGARVLNDSRQVSDSEPTLVIDLDRPLTAAEGDRLSAALDQQAIVQRAVDGSGELFGPMASEWGPYSPELFVLHDGGRGDAGPIASRAPGFSAKTVQPDATSVDAYHYSSQPGLKAVDPRKAGTVAAGGERRRLGMGNFGARGGTYARANFYVREDGAPVPGAEDVVTAAGGQHLYRVQLDNLYDLRTDPRGFAEEAGMNQDMLEEEISDAGFDGFVAGRQPGIDTPVAVVFDIGRKKIPVESASEGAAFSRAPQTETPEFRRWFGDSKVVGAGGEPLVVYRGEHGADTASEIQSRMQSVTFTDDPEVASEYATDPNQRGDLAEAPRVTAAYLRIANPIIDNREDPFVELGDLSSKLGRDEALRIARKFSDEIESTGNWIEDLSQEFDSVGEMLDAEPGRVGELYFDAYRLLDDAEEVARFKAAGYDGGIHVGNGTSADAVEYRVFDIRQVKSATGNSGAFDPENPSIIASRAPQTETPEFRRWFRDSKVVGAGGDPAVVYHGTNADFTEFRMPAWFANQPGLAEQFTGGGRTAKASGGQVYPVFLALSNPLDIEGALGSSMTARELLRYSGGEQDVSGISEPDTYRKVWALLDDEQVVAAIERAGFDGIKAREGGSVTWAAFRPTQIKSATGNSGAFDPENPSIIASRATPADAHRKRGQLFGRLAAAGYRQGSPTQPQNQTGGRFVGVARARDNAITVLQDKMNPLRRAQQRVSVDGAAVSSITLDDAMNAYRLENLMHGAVNDELKRIDQTHVKAIQDGIKKSPFTVEQFEDYLYAKAAPERNREIAKINQAMPDAGSGITTKMAGDILAGNADGVFSGERLTPEAIKLFDQLNRHVRAMRDLALDNMVSAGQITPQLAADLKAKYPNYVPMRGKDAELDEGRGSGTGSGRGISQRAADIRRALGRGADNIPVNILGELVGDAQRSVVAKGKAKVARALLRFALANPQPDLYTVEPVDLEWKFSEATGEAYLGVKRRGEDINETMLVMHEGNPVYIRITDPDLRDAILNMGVEDMGKALRVFSALNRWRSAVLTRFNPAFTPVNMARDLQFGVVAIAAEHGGGVAARTIAAYPAAMRAAYRHEAGRRGDASKPAAQRTMADWAAEAYANGMSTGVTHVPNVVDLQRDLVESTVGVMKLAASGRPLASIKQAWLRTAGPLVEVIENANGASENAIRLAVYTTLRKDGWSIGRAAEYAKNVTINFNRKGQAGSVLNAIFLFFNAAMQGTVAVARVLRKPKVVAYLGGLAALQGVIAAGLMDDEDEDGITPWDKIPDYVKRTSFIIPLGGDDYFALPMPYGFNWFTYLGGRGAQRMILGDRPTDKSIIVDMAKSLSEAFSPLPFQDGYRSLFGDQIGFAMGLASNTNDFGSPIAKDDAYGKYDSPRALEGKVTTPQVYHVAAQLLAKIGGGDLEERKAPVGWLDVAPEHIEAMVDYLGGGITSLGNKAMRMGEQASAGNIDDAMGMVSATPIASRLVVRANDSRAIADRYYGERGEFARHNDIVNARLDSGMSLEEAIKDRPDEYVEGMNQAKYKVRGRRKDGTRYRRGDPRTDAAGKPVIDQDRSTPAGVLKDVEKRNKSLSKAVTQIRAGKMTNAEIAELYDTHYRVYMATVGEAGAVKGATGKATDIGLPENFDDKAKAPARVRNRTIKLLQDIRAEEQRRLLRSLEFERRMPEADDDVAEGRVRIQ